MRTFYTVGFAPENQIGNAVELESHELPGFSPLALRQAGLIGKPATGFSPLALMEARRIGKLPPGIKLTVARRLGDKLDFDVVVNSMGWKILSERLGRALKDAAPNDLELLPVDITGLNSETLRTDFYVVNILQMLDAMSERKTVRSNVKLGTKYPVIKLAIIGSKVPSDVHVFRVTGCTSDFLVDNIAKNALSKQPHDGVVFIPVEQE